MAAPSARAFRDGAEVAIPARDLVPGDVVVLRAGDRVPADARLLLAANLSIDEAVLTGESVATDKVAQRLDDEELALGDRRSVESPGSLVTRGRGRAGAVAAGRATEFGRIRDLLETVDIGRPPLQANLDRLGALLGRAALGIVAVVVALGLLRGLPWLEMFIFG